MDAGRVAAGRALRAQVQGAKHNAFTDGLTSIDPRLAEWSDGWIFGEVWASRASLSTEDKMLVAIVALAATGRPEQLKIYLHGAVQAGASCRRIHEALLLLPVYVGFPTAVQALTLWRDVVLGYRRRGLDIDVPVS